MEEKFGVVGFLICNPLSFIYLWSFQNQDALKLAGKADKGELFDAARCGPSLPHHHLLDGRPLLQRLTPFPDSSASVKIRNT
ncbi:MAG: hypothetical protein D6785_08255 [Planctomycetota bacterium]|nr:MAG: hypothetical protein D6785_08255 [Planctomycetota bacterium]